MSSAIDEKSGDILRRGTLNSQWWHFPFRWGSSFGKSTILSRHHWHPVCYKLKGKQKKPLSTYSQTLASVSVPFSRLVHLHFSLPFYVPQLECTVGHSFCFFTVIYYKSSVVWVLNKSISIVTLTWPASVIENTHPCIFFCMSGACSPGQQLKQGSPDFLVHRHFVQLFW